MRRALAPVWRFLTRPTDPPAWSLLRWCLVAWPLMTVPALTLGGVAWQLAPLLGIDPSNHVAPERDAYALGQWAGMVLFAPLLETALLVLGLRVLKALGLSAVVSVTLSAIAWGLLHGAFGALWFFGPAWAFWVMGWAVEAWSPAGAGKAFAAAAIPHALLNGTVMVLLLFID